MSNASETPFTKRSGCGAFPLTQTIRPGAFGGVGTIRFSGSGEMLPGAVTSRIPCQARPKHDWCGARPILRHGQFPPSNSRPMTACATSARDDARSGRPLALTRHRAGSDFPVRHRPTACLLPPAGPWRRKQKICWVRRWSAMHRPHRARLEFQKAPRASAETGVS